MGCRIEGRVGIPGRGPFIPLFRRSRPPPSSERYPSEARRRPRGAATGSRGSTFPKKDEGRAILKRRRVKQRDRGRERERGEGNAGSSPSRSLPSFLHQQHTPASTDARCSEPLSYPLLPRHSFPSSLPAKPSRHADPTGILNARREADCLTAYAKPRSLDGGMAAREISTRK